MYAKTGMGLLAAAGVAVGVVGMTVGGASGSVASCTPTHGTSSGANDNTTTRSSSDRASDVAGANDTNANGAGGTTDPAGTDDNGNGSGTNPASANPGTTVIVGGTVPDVGSAPGTGSGSGSASWDRPLLHLTEHTNPLGAAGITAPPTGTSVIGRSSNISGLHIFGHVHQGR